MLGARDTKMSKTVSGAQSLTREKQVNKRLQYVMIEIVMEVWNRCPMNTEKGLVLYLNHSR